MSTHSVNSRRRGSLRLSGIFVLVGLLLALQLWLPLSSAAFAAPRLTDDPTESLARSGVSVVRLLLTYNNTQGRQSFQCTGLGALVGSWKVADNQPNTVVLTDGTLLNTTDGATCVAGGNKGAKLEMVKVLFSTAYNKELVLPLPASSLRIQCSNEKTCREGLALFAFNSSKLFPYLKPIQTNATTEQFGISLNDKKSSFALPPKSDVPGSDAQFETQMHGYITPNERLIEGPTAGGIETGLPVVNAQGQLLGMRRADNGIVPAQEISTFLQQQNFMNLAGPNSVQQSWETGINKYYESPKDFAGAQTAFHEAFTANAQFQGASDFEQRARTSKEANGNGNGRTTTVGTPSQDAKSAENPFGLPNFLFTKITLGIILLPLWTLLLILLLLALVIAAVLSLFLHWNHNRRFKREFEEAERRADVEAKRIAAQEAKPQPAPQVWAQPTTPIQQNPVVPAQYSPVLATNGSGRTAKLPKPDLRCPRCGEQVPGDANYCTNCRLLLSPTESGLHLRVPLPSPAAAPAPPAMPSPAAMAPTSMQAQPTQTSQLAPIRTGSLVEQPTLEIPGDEPTTIIQGGADSTQPFAVNVQGHRLGLVVGTQSNPGIKRKYKPNEDSLFAAQGTRTTTEASPFGLFVVADGMGGHANGQDASRSAIQTLVDYMLPRLASGVEMPGEGLKHLLAEGVQQANLGVHQHNMELRADMGTTVTAALVVDTTAYVSNVGDSRTYLYRQGEGLKKVTNDHSVVASLVDAGIIKPDDIYTHPKRNQIYRSLGEKPVVEIDTFEVKLQPGDKLLLCSDGLWDMVRDPKIEEVIKTHLPSPDQTAAALINAALEGGGEDNVSVIVVSVMEGPQQSTSTHFHLIAKPESVQVPPV